MRQSHKRKTGEHARDHHYGSSPCHPSANAMGALGSMRFRRLCDQAVVIISGDHSQPFTNPALRKPVTTYGLARISRQSNSDR